MPLLWVHTPGFQESMLSDPPDQKLHLSLCEIATKSCFLCYVQKVIIFYQLAHIHQQKCYMNEITPIFKAQTSRISLSKVDMSTTFLASHSLLKSTSHTLKVEMTTASHKQVKYQACSELCSSSQDSGSIHRLFEKHCSQKQRHDSALRVEKQGSGHESREIQMDDQECDQTMTK